MKFVELSKVRNLKFNQPVIVKLSDGVVTVGKLVKIEPENHTFELAAFYAEALQWEENMKAEHENKVAPHTNLKQIYATSVTHVAIP